MLTDAEVERIAKLARLELKPEEKTRMKKDLSGILDYINKLNQVNTDNVPPLYQVTGLVNSTRADKQREPYTKTEELLINQAPQKQDRFIKVRSVMKKK